METLSPTLNTVYAPPGMLELLTETRNLTAFWLEPVTVFGSLHLTVLLPMDNGSSPAVVMAPSKSGKPLPGTRLQNGRRRNERPLP